MDGTAPVRFATTRYALGLDAELGRAREIAAPGLELREALVASLRTQGLSATDARA